MMGAFPPWGFELAPRLDDGETSLSFIETGTLTGATAKLALFAGFAVWTTEADPRVYAKLFTDHHIAPYPARLRTYCLQSDIFLRWLFENNHMPSLLWLDAHWCGPHSHTMSDPQCNLRAELDTIRVFFRRRDVILIDDARLFTHRPVPSELDPDEWPMLEEIIAALPRHEVTVRDDVIVCIPRKEMT